MEGGGWLGAAAWTFHDAQVLAAMLVFGTALFPFYAAPGLRPDAEKQFLVYAGVSFLCAIAGSALKIADLNGDFSSVFSMPDVMAFFFETAFGLVWLARIMLSAALFGFSIRNAALPAKNHSGKPADGGIFAMLSGGILLTFAGGGHASALNSLSLKYLAILSESVHLLIAGAWVGSLPLLLILVSGRGRYDRDSPVQADILARFSMWAQPAVAVLLMAGFATVIALRPNASPVAVNSGYDAILWVKLTLVAAMLAIALLNRFVLLPRLGTSKFRTGLRYALMIECLLAVLVVAAGVTLSQTEP